MKIQSDIPEDMDPEMKIRVLEELKRVIDEEISAISAEIRKEGDL
jgi:metal-sulfur cluster biosynthetic enzyme